MDGKIDAVLRHWLWPVAIICGFLAYLMHTAADTTLSCQPENACFQQWVSALSGWAAAAGGAAAAIVILQQIKEANRHQRENVELHITKRLSIARRAIDAAGYYRSVSSAVTARAKSLSMNYGLLQKSELDELFLNTAMLKNKARLDALVEFDSDIGLSPDGDTRQVTATVDAISEYMSRCKKIFSEERDKIPEAMGYFKIVSNLSSDIQRSTDVVDADAKAFIKKWEARLA